MPSNPVTTVPRTLPYGVPVQVPQADFGSDGAITLVAGGNAFLTKASAGAYTLAAPYADGLRLTIVSTTAAAHVITCSPGLNGLGTSGDVATASAAIGNYLELVSRNGVWWIVANLNFTVA
jgi:hypothetical protein